MLCAIVADLSRIAGVAVATTWDKRLGPPPFNGCDVNEVTSPVHHAEVFGRLVTESDAVFLIAPETDGVLALQAREVEAMGRSLLGSSSTAIAICTDKLQLGQLLQSAGIPTLETHPFDATRAAHEFLESRFPMVIKPRDGAGSQSTYRVESGAAFARSSSVFAGDPLLRYAIWQPYVSGEAVSVAMVLSESGHPLEVFPVAEQRLSRDGRFAYLGGQVPARGDFHEAVRDVALRACRCVPGLRGYIGVDLIVPAGKEERSIRPADPLVVEINPRLTTSYLGYRALTTGNLAERLLAMDRSTSKIEWLSGTVTFDAAGQLG